VESPGGPLLLPVQPGVAVSETAVAEGAPAALPDEACSRDSVAELIDRARSLGYGAWKLLNDRRVRQLLVELDLPVPSIRPGWQQSPLSGPIQPPVRRSLGHQPPPTQGVAPRVTKAS
jgi:hypothetical protein